MTWAIGKMQFKHDLSFLKPCWAPERMVSDIVFSCFARTDIQFVKRIEQADSSIVIEVIMISFLECGNFFTICQAFEIWPAQWLSSVIGQAARLAHTLFYDTFHSTVYKPVSYTHLDVYKRQLQ